MSPGDPPRICARSAASSPAASTCDDLEAWASSTNLSGMEEIGLRAPAFGASGFGGLALGLQQSAFIQNNCKTLSSRRDLGLFCCRAPAFSCSRQTPSQFDVAPEPIAPI